MSTAVLNVGALPPEMSEPPRGSTGHGHRFGDAMTTPKQRRTRASEQPENEATFPPIIDERFDELDQADAEFSRWRWPGRNDAESGARSE